MFEIEYFDTDGPVYRVQAKNAPAVGGHLGALIGECDTVLVFKIEDGERKLVLRYDKDGYDL